MSQRRRRNEVPEKKPGMSSKQKAIYTSVISVLVVAVIGLLVWLDLRPTPPKPEPTKRFDDITHITLNHYKVLLNKMDRNDLKEEELEDFNEIILKQNIYVFIYNGEYDESETTKNLADRIIEIGEKEDTSYTFLVLNYYMHEGIKDLLDGNYLPVDPVLVHIEGEDIGDDGIKTNYLSILSILNKL